MRLKVISIGNSRGIRLPKSLLEQAGIENEVEVEVEGNTLILRSTKRRERKGCRDCAVGSRSMPASGDAIKTWRKCWSEA